MKKDNMISVTDEILFELYKIEHRSLCIEPLMINNEYYLVNKRGVKYKFELGLIVKIPEDMLEERGIDKILDGCYDHDPEYDDLMSRLMFTPKEMFIMNILLSNYLNTDSRLVPEICFKDIDYIRHKSSSYTNIVVPKETAESYTEIINSLCDKEIYLKTAPKFRVRNNPPKDYGVADRDFYQNLLVISDAYLASSNNLSFKYTFGQFGEVISLSRRWSNIVPNRCFQYNLNQSMNNIIAGEIARQIYVSQYAPTPVRLPKDSSLFCEFGFDLNVEYFFEYIEGENMKKIRYRRRNFNRKIEAILKAFLKENKIDRYEILDDEFYEGKSTHIRVILNIPNPFKK